jgi:hypothetical protein
MISETCAQKLAIFFIFLCVAMFQTVEVHAHGGGGSEAPAKKETKATPGVRSAPSLPNALNHAELIEIMNQDKSPSDVAIVRCTLNEFASCRGLQVGLYDKNGKQISIGNTGGEGVVGFEGLKAGHEYEARIDAVKYKGSVAITPGAAWKLNADRKVE